ncbi:hypothetical protein RM764_16305 [Streptomyces sp. DSM 41699]|uniref:Transposase n=1 Tax=Streptomyces gibsoniae TaxID=3075529 RepID=A0ABU2TUL7_9ACTN|nr:hypothetical protein [Streptomyces sp. DSM 41699]MDT0464565.1 hypothetical protein [Streptomyces sp. DSM 41699]
MTTELNTLVTALYVKIDDEWAGIGRLPGRPPKLSHSELLCLAVMQALLGFHCEARWLRHLRAHYRHLFPFIPQDSGYNKRLRAALPQIKRVIRMLAKDTDFWHDTVWIADSAPVPCGMSRPTVKRSELGLVRVGLGSQSTALLKAAALPAQYSFPHFIKTPAA